MNAHLPWSGIHSATALAALVFVVIAVGFALRPVNYAFWVLFGTPLILLIGDITDQGDWHAAAGRIAMTIVGTAAAVVGHFLFLPDWEANRLPGQLGRAADKTADYLDAVLARLGFHVVRFSNQQALLETDAVIDTIASLIAERPDRSTTA